MSKKIISTALEQEVAARFLLGTRRYDHREFLIELNRVGLKFAQDKVDPGDDQQRFAAAFDELVKLGCLPETLASTLYCFCKSYLPRKVSSHPYWQGIPPPLDEEIRMIRESLQSATEGIRRVDAYGILEILTAHGRCSDPPEGRKEVLSVLRWYLDSLPFWWVPRRDIVQSSAPIACCIYPQMATRKFRFPQVAILLECLGYRPDPKRQTKSKYRPRGYNSCDESLERNFRNFRKAYPMFCDQLQVDLKRDHEEEGNRRKVEFHNWIDEKGIPSSVFNQLRPNQFDWKFVFPRPEQKQKRGRH
jgi:hypothetical protein